MTPIAFMVREMLERGVDAEVIVLAVEAAEMVAARGNSGGIPPDSAAEKRRAYDRDRKRNSTGNPPESTGIPKDASITTDLKKESKRQNRGTRIASDWILSDAERAFAKHEGFSDFEINREVNKFRDYWTACAGSKGVKLDWPATWRQWIRSGAERAGKTPTNITQNITGTGFYAKADSEQLSAWDAWTQKTTGKSMPRDKNGGWNVKAEWPPEYVRPEKVREMSATPLFRSM